MATSGAKNWLQEKPNITLLVVQTVVMYMYKCHQQGTTGGSRLMLLLGLRKNSHKPKIALAKFLFYVRSNKINSL